MDGRAWKAERDDDFDKLLSRLPKYDAERIRKHLAYLNFDPYQGDIRKLKGETDV